MRLFLFLSCIVYSSCRRADSLAKVWMVERGEAVEGYRPPGAEIDYALPADAYLNLKEDGTYAANWKRPEEGRWQVREGRLLLINRQKRVTEFPILRQTRDSLVLADKAKQYVYALTGFPNPAAGAEDPFSVNNNRWRIAARHRENDKELQARLKNHFCFWQQYFAWGKKTGIATLNVRSTPSLLKLYGNGFELEYFEYLPSGWRQLFYDTVDCRRAYEMVYYKMYEQNITWPKTEDRFELLASAFAQAQRWMDEPVSKYVGQK